MLIAVIGGLHFGYRRRWQGVLFRHAEVLRLWSMPGVYVLAGIVTYSRLAAEIGAEVLTGGWCFVSAALLLLLGDMLLDRRRVWQAIRPDASRPGPLSPGALSPGALSLRVVPSRSAARPVSCSSRRRARDDALPALRPDARTGASPDSLRRTAALTVAALVLYPAGLLIPMTRAVQPGGLVQMNVLDGIGGTVPATVSGIWASCCSR